MGIGWRRDAQGAKDVDLPRRIIEMVIPADHMGDGHVYVIDHHREIIGRRPIYAGYNEIIEFLILKGSC